MTTRRFWLWSAVATLIGLAGLGAFLEPHLLVPGFSTQRVIIDIEKKTAVPNLAKGFLIIPSVRYAGVVHVKNKGEETAIQFQGLPPQKYVVKLKVRFFSKHQRIALVLNGHPLGEAIPRQPAVAGTPGDQFAVSADIHAIKKALGWEPAVSLREGLSRMVSWATMPQGTLR